MAAFLLVNVSALAADDAALESRVTKKIVEKHEQKKLQASKNNIKTMEQQHQVQAASGDTKAPPPPKLSKLAMQKGAENLKKNPPKKPKGKN